MNNNKILNSNTENEKTNYTETLFDSIRHINEYGQEFWYARELQIALEYKRWDKFSNVIEKAKIACQNSELTDIDHFVVDNKMVEIGSGAKREQKDYKLNSKDLKYRIYFYKFLYFFT